MACLLTGVGAALGWASEPCPAGQVYTAAKSACAPADDAAVTDAERASQALSLLDAKDAAGATAILATAKDPAAAPIAAAKGVALLVAGKLDEAQAALTAAQAADPKSADARAGLGQLALARGDVAAAEAELLEVERLCGELCAAYRRLDDALNAGG